MTDGPLKYPEPSGNHSTQEPLSETQEACLALAAVGIVGKSVADVPFADSAMGGGNILSSLVSRTAISPDAAHTVSLIVINDDNVHFVRRPQNFSSDAPGLRALFEHGDNIRWEDGEWENEVRGVYRSMCVTLDTKRRTISDERPHVPTFNRWASNKPGTTYFLPVIELSELYLNALFAGLNPNAGYFLLDASNRLAPAGLAPYAKSEGGWLDDHANGDKVTTLDALDTAVAMFASVELGACLQNLSLMAMALGLGGWPHYAAGTKWMQELGFDGVRLRSSQVLGLPPDVAATLRLLDKDTPVWSPTGLKDPDPKSKGEYLIKPFCPPCYASMKAAVEAFQERKFGKGGTLRQPGRWKEALKPPIPEYEPRLTRAAVEHAEYVFDRYGRFPAKFGPLATLTAFQAHRLDASFYEAKYEAGVYDDVVPLDVSESPPDETPAP
jgi:hypothetical protein